MISDSLGFHERSLNGPEPAELVRSHSWPRSPSFSCAMRQLLVDHRADGRGQAVEEEGRRVGLVELDREGAWIDHLDHVVDVLGSEAELAEDEGRRLVELDHPLQRPDGVIGGQRIAGVKGDAVADLEGIGLAVVGDLPALGDVALQLLDVVRRVGDQPVVDVGRPLGRGELEHLGRIEGDHLVELVGHDQGVLRRLGAQRRHEEIHRQKDENAEQQP